MLSNNCNFDNSCAIVTKSQRKMITLLIFMLLWSKINSFNIINEKVTKVVNLKSQTITHEEIITFTNIGHEDLYHYAYVLDPNTRNVYVEFRLGDSEVNLPYNKDSERAFTVNLTKAVPARGQETITVFVVVLDELRIIRLNVENRVVKYMGNLNFYSPYKTVDYMASYEINDQELIIDMAPTLTVSKNNIVYRMEQTPPYQYSEFRIYYINNNPFYVVTRLNRKIDISHFGYISVEDNVEVVNIGQKLKGPFSPTPGSNREDLYTYLPASAFDVKLFDSIGNNSKSNIRYSANAVIVLFQPRYPLQRSWKTSYTLQYTTPAYEYLRRSNNTYVLKMRAVDYTLPDAIVKYAETRVVLPSDSELRNVVCGDGHVAEGGLEFATTALAPKRVVVLLISKDLVHDTSIPEFTVQYTRSPLGLFKPALYIVAYVEGCFLFYLFASYNWPKLSID